MSSELGQFIYPYDFTSCKATFRTIYTGGIDEDRVEVLLIEQGDGDGRFDRDGYRAISGRLPASERCQIISLITVPSAEQ
jgi:hypothetical protein